MHEEPETRPTRIGDYALAAGIGAAGSAVLPGVGDLLAAPAGLVAIGLGLVGLHRYESGRESHAAKPAIGAALGACAVFAVYIVAVATH